MINLFSKIPEIRGERITLTKITKDDAAALRRLAGSDVVYRYETTFLYERKYDDIYRVIDGLYDECLEESLILGVFERDADAGDKFCGIADKWIR